MKILAALDFLIGLCGLMVSQGRDTDGSFSTTAEICKQLKTLGEIPLRRLLQRMSYILEVLRWAKLPPFEEVAALLRRSTIWIDSNRRPTPPKGYRVVLHDKQGLVEWDPERVTLHQVLELDPETVTLHRVGRTESVRSITGTEFLEELRDKLTFNACVGYFLLENQDLISVEWRSRYLVFPDTLFQNRVTSELLVLVLIWDGESKFNDHYRPIGETSAYGYEQVAVGLVA